MRILAIITGQYGRRHVDNIRKHGPATWKIDVWEAPTALPLVIDYPEDYIPETMPPADLILSFAEHKGIAELLPEVAEMTGAQAVVVAVDNQAWLPKGLARQLRGWLADINVASAMPKPLCSLTEHDYGVTLKQRIPYESPQISEFVRFFGRPELEITVDPVTRCITAAAVSRDAVCGCARHVAENLVGLSADEVAEKAGLLHHHYPCLAGMIKDPDFNYDTLMHASARLLQENIKEQVKPFKQVRYIRPGKRSDS